MPRMHFYSAGLNLGIHKRAELVWISYLPYKQTSSAYQSGWARRVEKENLRMAKQSFSMYLMEPDGNCHLWSLKWFQEPWNLVPPTESMHIA